MGPYYDIAVMQHLDADMQPHRRASQHYMNRRHIERAPLASARPPRGWPPVALVTVLLIVLVL